MKKPLIYVVAAVAVFFAARAGFRAWDIYDSRSVALGAYQAAAKVAKAREKVHLAEIRRHEAAIKAQTAAVAKAEAEALKGKLTAAALKEDLKVIETALTAAKTDAERVVILTNEVKKMADIISAQDAVIVNLERAVDGWTIKYNHQVKISEGYLEMWKAERERADACDRLQRVLARDLRIARMSGTVKTGVLVATAGVAAYTLLKK